MPRPLRFLVTCEHGGNGIPPRYRRLFANSAELLQSHRGYDPGALAVARQLARALRAPLIYSTTSRLLVDLNRAEHHPRLHGMALRRAPAALRREILARCYLPYRRRAEGAIRAAIAAGARVLHLSSHSFTPTLDGRQRNADIGLLYDPARSGEARLCQGWQAALQTRLPMLKVRRNYPYRGTADGLCRHLRRQFAGADYLGIELEVNQQHVRAGTSGWRRLRDGLVAALGDALAAEAQRCSAPPQ